MANDNENTQSFTISFDFDGTSRSYRRIVKKQNITLVICIITLILVLLLNLGFIWLSTINAKTEQIGLIALIESAYVPPDIPDYDPIAIPTPDDDKVKELNEKLDKGKMCINMVSSITMKNTYSSGYFNIVNDKANNYPQFVTLVLDSNNTEIYQSGLIDPGKCIPYDTLDVVLPAGTYECTAVFTQVDTVVNKLCGQASAKVVINIQN